MNSPRDLDEANADVLKALKHLTASSRGEDVATNATWGSQRVADVRGASAISESQDSS